MANCFPNKVQATRLFLAAIDLSQKTMSPNFPMLHRQRGLSMMETIAVDSALASGTTFPLPLLCLPCRLCLSSVAHPSSHLE